jgi:hypothetical protein
MFDYTRARLTQLAVARVARGKVWRVLIAQDSAKSMRDVAPESWRRVFGWKTGFLTPDSHGLVLWKLRGWGAEPVFRVSADDILAVEACQEWLSDWHYFELPAVDFKLRIPPGRLVVFPSVVRSSEMARFQRELVTWATEARSDPRRDG